MMAWMVALLLMTVVSYGIDAFLSLRSQRVASKSVMMATSRIIESLTGVFSNEEQAAKDASLGKLTGLEGGHEFVTACIKRHPTIEEMLVATYFYGNDKSSVFRYRLYEICGDDWLEMKLYRPTLEHDEALKMVNYAPIEAPRLEDFEYLAGCDVVWEQTGKENGQPVYEGSLGQGECTICSQVDPTRMVTVKDNLRVSATELWINDRVYTTAGAMIIGNSEGVPYKLKKI